MVEGEKMSKSAGNFFTLRDLIEKGWTGREIRYALITVNYRLPLNFTFDGLAGARSALGRIDEWVARLQETALAKCITPEPLSSATEPKRQISTEISDQNEVPKLPAEQQQLLTDHLIGLQQNAELTEGFFECLDNDLNISGAMGQLFDLIRESNRALDAGKLGAAEASALLVQWERINSVLGFERDAVAIPAEVLALVEQRQAARTAKNWAESDRLRDAIAELGWIVKDTKDGAKLTAR